MSLADDVRAGRKRIISVAHPCAGSNPLVRVTFDDGDSQEMTPDAARDLLSTADRTGLDYESLLDALG